MGACACMRVLEVYLENPERKDGEAEASKASDVFCDYCGG